MLQSNKSLSSKNNFMAFNHTQEYRKKLEKQKKIKVIPMLKN